MRFYDEVTITVQSGKWWDGLVTWRRETGIPYWWPSGWNGWKWWSIILQSSKDINTLLEYRYKKIFKAKPGEPGRSKEQYGANATDIILNIPVGTIIKDKNTGQILHIFSKDKQSRIVLSWWEWWVGNMHFKDSVNQFPTFCLLGEPWHSKQIVLELQLLADVALIGTPSVGKSSIINCISNTKAQVAEYPFTTLIPNLWSVQEQWQTFNVIDIPWLISWAAKWKWLGNAFLRHILKARIFCLVADVSRYDKWAQEIPNLLDEILIYIQDKFGKKDLKIDLDEQNGMINLTAQKDKNIILEKKILILINKYDLLNDQEILTEYQNTLIQDILWFLKKQKIWKKITAKLLSKNIFTVSAATHYGIADRLKHLILILENTHAEEIPNEEDMKVSNPVTPQDMIIEITKQDKKFLIDEWYLDEANSKFCKIRQVSDPEICKLVWMLPRWNDEAENRFWTVLENRGYMHLLQKAWVAKWDVLKIISYYDGKEPRYILF